MSSATIMPPRLRQCCDHRGQYFELPTALPGGGAIAGLLTTGIACAGGSFTATLVSATIAGINATVNYAGCSPTYVGLDQWNIVVPAGVPDGCYLPLQVTESGVSSITP